MKLFLRALVLVLIINSAFSQSNKLIGYWHNWNDYNAPYMQLDIVDSTYDYINVSFAVPMYGTDYQMQFIPDQISSSQFAQKVQILQQKNKKVVISIGGATAPISLDNAMERDSFIVTMNRIISDFNFDGIDIDLEGASVTVSGGTIANPIDAKINNMIYAIKEIMANYRQSKNKKLILTMAPETAFVVGGMSVYGSIWGAYLPIIHALRDSIDILQMQLYNSGSMYGIDGNIYTQGNADFILAMTEALIQGFNTSGGFFAGIPASKIAVALPAVQSAAGGGYTDTSAVKNAIKYLLGKGTKPGNYTLQQSGGYPNLLGMMTWSINWDASNNYKFAKNYRRIFLAEDKFSIFGEVKYPKYKIPSVLNSKFFLITSLEKMPSAPWVKLYDTLGVQIDSTLADSLSGAFEFKNISPGIYFVKLDSNLPWKNSKPWQVSILDANLLKKTIGLVYILDSLQAKAVNLNSDFNINGSPKINIQDVNALKKRVGLVVQPNIWKIPNYVYAIEKNGTLSTYLKIEVSDSNLNINIRCLSAGDINGQ